MAMDGSFSLESAMEGFLTRCPKLSTIDKLQRLVETGHTVTEEEVVRLLAELFLNPNYTISLIGSFRPVARMIVDQAVALLRNCNLSSGSDDIVGDFVDADVLYVIEHYERSGRGLKLHELACLAFCRALDLDHSLLGSVTTYFKFAPPPFERILRKSVVSEAQLFQAANHYLLAVRISYRLLLMQPEFFSEQWNWSCFLDLVKKSVNLDLVLVTKDAEVVADIKWCGIQILCTILGMSDKAVENFGVGAEEAALCLLRWEEFCQDVAIEKFCLYVGSSELTNFGSFTGGIKFSQQNLLKSSGLNSLISSHCHQIEPVIKSRRVVTWDDRSTAYPFVVTSMMSKSFEMVLLAVSQKWPVLLYGPPGAGKTALINKLAHDAGNQVLSIHMDDQIDGKTLIGSYVCTEQPGEFRWQPGSLIQAVLNGYWVVFEDIDKAPSDVQSILLPLLEGEISFITNHGEEIRVAESFQLFSTITTSKSNVSHTAEGGSSLSTLWRKVMIGLPSNDDLENIMNAWYPSLGPLTGRLIETMERVNPSPSGNTSCLSCLNRFSLRDLLKWCKRISELGLDGDTLTAYQCRLIYQEAVDIFASFSVSSENRLNIMRDIAKLWGVPISETGILYPYKPEIQNLFTELRIGRVTLQRTETVVRGQERLVEMRSSLYVLEQIACAVKYNESILLVGETGTGKTTLVQNLAMMLGQKLTVLNLSQQSDVADLLGGFKPIDSLSICIPLYKEFEVLFSKTFSMKENDKIFAFLQKQMKSKNWKTLLNGFKKYVGSFQKKLQTERSGSGKKRKKPLDENIRAWESFSVKLETALRQIEASSGMLFSFVEGSFITALRNGEWILLDEVNLAPPETLQRVIGVLEGEYGSLCLAERGDVSHIPRHPSFRIFACMNPATDAGKRDLPYSLQSRFTAYFVHDVLDRDDLKLFINKFMEESISNIELEKKIIDFYEAAKKKSEERLQDGANQKPQYSLRSLYRALEYTREAKGKFGFPKAIYDGFCMFFLTMLDRPSAKIMKKMIKEKLLGGNKPKPVPFDAYLRITKISGFDDLYENYVLTKSVKKQLENLARAVFIKRYPVLLQGPTSSGKTSLVQYLAARTGHEFVRINNHEHTDLQEYLGSYISDAQGKLVFQEGILVKAVRNGHWIVLDELNLAPSDVLEALNRLLDDNRELFVPELRETVRAHPNFMLFATQNPPTFYGGRKMLSRAFRNRFVEVHVDEIPDDELSTIIEKRCKIPGSRAKLMVEVMKELQLHRQSSKVFAGKHGFITPRDLFRWANRLRAFGDSKEVMAEHGYYLLADRLRDDRERHVVQEVLERRLRVKIARDDLYKESIASVSESIGSDMQNLGDVILTRSMRRLYFLVKRCFELREPVLLVGETGGGKTTVCQLLSRALGLKLHILNCHQYTETSDFIGGFFPVRERSRLASEFKYIIEKWMLSKAYTHFPQDLDLSSDIVKASSTLDHLNLIITSYRQGHVSCPNVSVKDIDSLEQMKLDLTCLHQKWQTIFMWQDGPLVQAMKSGDLFLVDEISLADDSVLERLNSVLEPERKLSLAEKGGPVMDNITAHEFFFVLATMNPGGDYGKKELSPALRNRFTEIWVPPVCDLDELGDIASKRLSNPELTYIVDAMLKFWEWFNKLEKGRILTVRDLLSWIQFIMVTTEGLGPDCAFLHGLFLVLLDGISLGTGISSEDAGLFRETCLSFLLKELKEDSNLHELSFIENYGWGDLGETGNISCSDDMQCDNSFGIDPFYIEKGYEKCEAGGFEFLTPTTRRNALRVLRAMQLPKPVLLEGSPGVGKTSLIMALGKYSGHKVVRINLSEQTDLMDLLGTDLPVESDEGMKFAWSDGILLQALKEGCWVLLDELNLAPQSVLEGLNAILDHRAEVFIPELSLTFKCPSSFRIFACQNPFSQGGGRKGLPKSFLNRFTKVYIDELVEGDYLSICNSIYPSIPRPLLSKLIVFNKRLHEDTMFYHKFGQDGSPWEFNLRDVIRSCQIIEGVPEKLKADCFLNILYVQRMRTAADRKEVLRIYEEVFGVKPFINPYPRVQLNSKYLVVGNTVIKRNTSRSSKLSNSALNVIPSIRHNLEAVAHCIKHQWLCILVGPPCSGKTSLIRLLAHLTGNVLNELSLSTTTDISELLGCFEQYNAFRNFRSVIAQVERYVSEYCNLQLEFSKVAFMKERSDLITKWLAFLSTMNSSSMTSSSSIHVENWESMTNSLSLLVEIIQQMKMDVVANELLFSWSTEELNKTIKVISKLQDDQQRRSRSVKFEWVAGLLIKAIENGEWIILENANLCNPTVLDRINSLVEPSGSITVNECGIVDGSSVVLHPHHNFRIFLTVNPSHGEVSRAMRNRGVEIFMMPPYWLYNDESGCSGADFELKDVKRFLVSSGILMNRLVDSMSKAHVYAKNEGLHVNVQISYLELAHWVQLFHQLLINGNQPFWSLQLSWEHTYLSSLGEAVGWDIVNHAKAAYFSTITLSESDLPTELSFNMPVGLPVPKKLRDFIWYSKETSVRQNLMYLEYLVAQYELGFSRNMSCVDNALSATSHMGGTGWMDMKMMGQLMFPKALNCMNANSVRNTEIDMKLAKRMLVFAANWTIEQATGSDYKLYLLHFRWFSSKLQSCDHFFGSFLHLLEQELEHPIWKCIFHSYHELASLPDADPSLHLTPLLSLDFVDLSMSYDRPKVSYKFLCNAINCIELLRLSYLQWNAQSEHEYTNEAQHFKPVLGALQELEKEILNMLVESPSYDILIKLYSEMLEDHLTFWDVLTSSRFEQLPVSWHSLIKDILKLRDFSPVAVDNLFMIAGNIDKKLHQHSQQSLLWIHGGHPILPATAELFKQQQLFTELCESVWPTTVNPYNQGDDCLVKVAASSTPELRFLAVQGICMSAYITSRFDEDSSEVVLHLADMSQMLLKRFEYEKSKLEAKLNSIESGTIEGNSIFCCDFSPEARCTKPGFASWLETRPIIDNTSFFLDMDLLQKLSMIVLADRKECQLALRSVSNLLESAMKHSLTFSTRPPQNFIPHQKILWTLDAWMSVDAVNAKIASYVLEMWFWWHSSLWNHCPAFTENFGKVDGYHTPVPDMLVQPVRTASVVQSLRRTCAIKDYSVHCLKLKAASCNLWQSSLPGMDLSSFLLSVTRSLFQQIIYAHRKAFDADKFAAIESIFCSFHKNVATQDDIQCLVSILGSSNHQNLNSLVSFFIEPILKELYLHCSSTEVHLNMGHACLKMGALRFSLLLSCDDSDPAMKYSFKHSQLEERISSLELEIKVRQECDYLAGQLSSIEADKKRADALERLEIERRRIQKKMVFRCNPLKFNALRKECGEFLKPARKVVGLVDNIEGMDLQQVLEQASNWQATATSFIDRLSDEYKEYIDLAQPFQVAVYEMKLGLSLVLSFTLLKKVLNTIKEDNMDGVMESIYSFMRFPRVHAFISSSHSIGSPANFWDREMGILEKLIMLSSDVTTEKMGSILQLRTGLYQNIVVRVAHFVADTQRIDDASFKILDKMFHEFANMWMNMKVQVKCKEGDDAQQYKFRPRALEIKSIVDVDFSTLDQFFPKDSFSEWQEFLSEEESLEKLEASNEHENVQDEWDLMQETIMKNMICIHNQLFGSTNLVLDAGTFHVDDADRLHSFTNSYTLGAGMIEGLGGLLTSSLDGKLIPEHLLRLCLEHGSKLVSSQKSSANYNFYKDSNAPMMAKMVKLVANLQLKICTLLSEWEDHPGLQKIMDTIQMLLAIPVETPLAKVLLGLQFLLNRARALQENESKFALSDQLEPISALVCSWQKMEFDSWPALLQEVQEQYDINAGKLWFPLFSVLHHSHSADITRYEESTIESIEEFIRTSSIGEFRARLQLLFALHGQITAGRCLEVQNYLSPQQEKNLQVLYNVFGYYIQFLPRILEDIEANRKGIEMELKEILKLFHWERTEICLSVENSKRTRQKLRKLILKYTDLLQQPVMLILDRETQQKGLKIHSLQFPRALKDNKNAISDLAQLCEKDRSIWLADWRKKVNDTLQNLHFKNTSGLSFLDNKDVTSITRQSLASHSSHLSCDEQWNVLCWTAEKIFKTAMDCDDLWNDTGKGVGKKRALSELLKLLETSGLHKHKFEIMKISNSSNWLFVQPSYNAQHLLLTPSRLSGEALDVSTYSESQCLPDDYVDTIWKSANEFYFKSVASVQLLQRLCLKPHGDITYDQASRAVSFLNHLIVIQQSQRAAAYDFSKQSKCLRECTYAFGNSYLKCTDIDETTNSEYSIVQNQRALFQCMWKQKQLFDGLTTLLAEESLLLRTVESTHLKSCQSVRPAANHVLQFIEKFIPVTQKSKESLDNYLLGQLGGLQSLLQESLDKSLLGRDVTLSAGPSRPYIISKQMEQLVYKNFQVIKEFEEHFFDFRKQDWNRSFIIETLLGHFDDVFKEGKMLADQFESAVKQRSQTRDSSEEVGYNSGNNYQLEADFDSALKKAHNLVMEALEKQISPGDEGFLSEESLENISSWEYLFKSSVQGLNVEELCDTLLNIIICAKKLVDHSGSETSRISFRIGRCFQHLHLLLELILGFCDGLLQDLLAMHKTVSIMTCELANVLASLFSKGFCISVKDEVDEASHDTSQTASGTGMGEGSGLNDVSDQITDEDQLLGTSEKPGDEQDASGEVPDKNEKGVEMEDLMADTFSVSDDSGEENEEDGEDEQLDSAMGEAGSDSEIVDEKLQNKDEDDNPNKTNERYESGPSVRDNDTSSRELRAKEDSAAITDDEPGEPDKQNNEIGNQDDLDDREENTDDMNMDKEEAFTDPTGLKLDESNQGSEEDMEMDEDMNEEGELDSKEEVSPEEGDESAEHGNNEEDNTIPTDETMEEPDSKPVDGTTVKDEPGRDREERSETNAMEPGKDEFELGISDLISDHVHGAESATQPNGPSQASDSKNATAEANMSNTSEAHNDLSLRSLPSGNTSQKDLMVSDSSNSGGFTNEQKQAQFPERESSDQRAQPNPYRNVGDALEEWKERVKVSVDLPGDTTEVSGEIEDKNADDYAFVSEFEKGTDQALGPATSEQIESNVNVNRSDEDNLSAQRDEVTKMEIEERDDKEWHLNYHASILRNKMEEQLQISDFKSEKEGSPEVQDHNGGDPQNMPESAISVRKSYLSEDMYQPDNLSVDDNELGKAQVPEEVPLDVKGSAAALWSRYELRTTRLSQELAEQLRLVLEPTIASKLQGDYKTGKRINMKKVIPYIASHYRKDKIWLRRTRPNKRDYQVVIAVDDSRSMSESCCGDVAVEALVTVCRAMSQLEMGNMAVASFGRKGNIRSLHDFDQPFTGEAGKKIISSLTFKQENTIADEPVVDLLKYLNNKLDAAVAKARLPSGQNPLQQLVLIIADGRFHEKEKLKRCVRDFLSRKRMVAFLVLDSPQESIMDQMEASFVGEGGKRELKFTKYLDSFPFPYYIVLKNIEALPRTLADLLRQWFELMQSSRE